MPKGLCCTTPRFEFFDELRTSSKSARLSETIHICDLELLVSFQSDKFQQLRDAQQFVLTDYSTKRLSSSDVAIELPTGAGKTLIALLILKPGGRRVRRRNSIGNKTLARQMLEEAKALGIPAVLMEGRGIDIPSRDKRAYQRAASVA